MITKQLDPLREESKTNPGVTPEMIAKLEAGLEDYIAKVKTSEEADRHVAASAQALNRAAENLLSLSDLPDGKPIAVVPPKPKGN